MTAVGRLTSLTIDAVDADRVARFWAELLGTRIGSVWDDGPFVFLEGGDELPVLCVQRGPEPKSGKNRVHVDLAVEDLDAATDRVVELGGSWEGDELRLPGVTWRTLRDPEGNEFDVAVEEDG